MVTRTPALADYGLQVELYGPELVLETAAHDVDERELAKLRGYVGHIERTKRWHLPHRARSDMKRHAQEQTEVAA
jgi:hypothetical protein